MTRKYKKKTPIQKARDEADAKFQEVGMTIKKNPYCEICLIKLAYCVHHYIEKSLSNRLRYEVKNGVKVCVGCHNSIHSTSDPALFRKLDKAVGEENIKWLEKIRREPVKINLEFYKNALKELKNL